MLIAYSILIGINLLEQIFAVAVRDVLSESLQEALELPSVNLAILVLVGSREQSLARLNVLQK
jgi:hypothetical protein